MNRKLKNNIKRIPLVKPLVNILYPIYSNIGKDSTQSGEYSYIKKLINKKDLRYLVDIGAHDGESISNSAPLIAKGWKGILVEPLPGPFKSLNDKYSNNSNVVCMNAACSDKKEQTKFYLGKDGDNSMYGTLCNDNNDWMNNVRSEKSITVNVDTLTNILKSNKYPKNFTILFIDTEGMDYEVLLGLNFNEYKPKIIVTEEYEWNKEKHAQKYKLLETNGYTMKNHIGCNTIWVSNQ